MPRSIGRIEVPDTVDTPVGTFPLTPDFPWGRAHSPTVIAHRMGTLHDNGKTEQRYLLGDGAARFTVHKARLTNKERISLETFWQTNQGGFGCFTYHAPNEDGTFTDYPVRFENKPLSIEYLFAAISQATLTLVEIVVPPAPFTVARTLNRFPDDAFSEALLQQVQRFIPLIKIQPKEPDYPAIYLADRLCVVDGITYEPRLLDFDGIEQSIGGDADQGTFRMANADRILTDLTNDTNLWRADLEFSFYHINTQTKLDLWKGEILTWKWIANNEVFTIQATDGFYELNLPYPRRLIDRKCWKVFNNADNGCPFADNGAVAPTRDVQLSSGVHQTLTFTPDATVCDKGWDTQNGCLAHTMERFFGGIVAKPQTVRIKDNSTGVWGFGRNTLTSASMIADSVYGEVVAEIYCNIQHQDEVIGYPVNCKIIAGREEDTFYAALGVVGEGKVQEFARARNEIIVITDDGIAHRVPRNDDIKNIDDAATAVGVAVAHVVYFSLPDSPHKLDGQPPHGFASEAHDDLGLRVYQGEDPTPPPVAGDSAPNPDGYIYDFSLSENKKINGTHGVSFFGPEKAAGTAWLEIRRTDEKGLQLSRLDEHHMTTAVRKGLNGWVWTDQGGGTFSRGTENDKQVLSNPIWICCNAILRARGLFFASDAEQQAVIDIRSAIDAAAICDLSVNKLIGDGQETQFTFTGIIQERKPLRDWIQEILNNCLGYYTIEFGKIKFGIRENASVVEVWSDANTIYGSFECEPLKPSFNRITGTFADAEYGFVSNTVTSDSEIEAQFLGGDATPQFLVSSINYSGASSKSQVARLITTRLREELGGYRLNVIGAARQGTVKTTLLGLTVAPGYVCSYHREDNSLPTYFSNREEAGVTDPVDLDVPSDITFRIPRWRLNKDFTVDIDYKTIHREVYDLVAGPKPADVPNIPVGFEEIPPRDWRFYAYTKFDGKLRLNRLAIGTNSDVVDRGLWDVYYIDEAANAYGTVVGSINSTQTTFRMSGSPPVDHQHLLIESELMKVSSYVQDPLDPNFGDVVVERGQLGTKAAGHTRVTTSIGAKDPDFANHIAVGANLELHPGYRFVVDDGGGPPFDQQAIASYDRGSGDAYVALEMTTGDVGDAVYADHRLWRVGVVRVIENFSQGFFRRRDRGEWERIVDLPQAGVVCVQGQVENSHRGLKSNVWTVLPVSSDTMAQTDQASLFPNRLRTFGAEQLQMAHLAIPGGATDTAFLPWLTPAARTWQNSYAEIAGGPLPPIATPPTVSDTVPTDLKPWGSIDLGGTVNQFSSVYVYITQGNELGVNLWQAKNDVTAIDPTTAAVSLTAWLMQDTHFAMFYDAVAVGTAVHITDKLAFGGKLWADVGGLITANAVGFIGGLNVTIGRRYAVAYSGGGFLSELSPLSPSTGPTGAANVISIKDIPIPDPADTNVTDVRVYATPDGKDEPFYLVAEVSSGSRFASDFTIEADLQTLPQYPGSTQPIQDGSITITVRKDGDPWYNLFIPKDASRSNVVHGFALDPVAENTEITADFVNEMAAVDMTLVLQ